MVFALDQLAQPGPNGGARGDLAVFSGDAAAEEMAEFEDAARTLQVFSLRDAGDGGFVQAKRFGERAQREWLHRRFAVCEEVLLALDDFLGDAQDGAAALFELADEVLRFGEPLAQGFGAPRRSPRIWA